MHKEAGAIKPDAHWFFPGAPSACLHKLIVTLSHIFLSFSRNRSTQLLAHFYLFCLFWRVFFSNGSPFWVTCLETLSTCRVPSVPGKPSFPEACPFVFLLGERCPWKSCLSCWPSQFKSYVSRTQLRPCQWTWHLQIALLITMHMKCPQIPKHWAQLIPYPGRSYGNQTFIQESPWLWWAVLLLQALWWIWGGRSLYWLPETFQP